MREDIIGRLVLLPAIWMVAMAAGTEDQGTIDILITRSTAGFSAKWDWDEVCLEDVTFKALYKKVGAPDSKPQECVLTEECSCEIPSDLLDHNHNYTLLVSATSPDGRRQSASEDFDPNSQATPPPEFRVIASDALVTVKISTSDILYKNYDLILRRNDSNETKTADVRGRTYIIPPSDLLPERTYCVKLQEYNSLTTQSSPFSPEECFTAPAKGPPNNLRMEALDSTYLLRWDWDFDQAPNVTFSVEKCHKYDGCTKIKRCENITSTQCNCSVLHFAGEHILRATVYDGQREEQRSSVIQFEPSEDTIFGPPKDLTMQILHNELLINVSAPEGFKNRDIYYYCDWLTLLEYWINSTYKSEVIPKEADQPFFHIDSLQASTTYCAKAKMKCKSSNRSSLYSEVYCITTDPKSLVAWITGFAFLGIIVIAVVLYVCFCPLKRYIKHTFFPSNKLPSSIDKGFGESPLDCIKHPFLMHEEETTDRCYIVQNSNAEDLVQITYKNTSQSNSEDSGNCTNEGQTPEETGAPHPSDLHVRPWSQTTSSPTSTCTDGLLPPKAEKHMMP